MCNWSSCNWVWMICCKRNLAFLHWPIGQRQHQLVVLISNGFGGAGAERNCAIGCCIDQPAGYFTDQPSSWTSLVSDHLPSSSRFMTTPLAVNLEKKKSQVFAGKGCFRQMRVVRSHHQPFKPQVIWAWDWHARIPPAAFLLLRRRLPPTQPIFWRWPKQPGRKPWAMMTWVEIT